MRVGIGLSLIWLSITLASAASSDGLKIADLGLRVSDAQGVEHDTASIFAGSQYAVLSFY
jgi:hypothetical protein